MSEPIARIFRNGLGLCGHVIALPTTLIVWMVKHILAPILVLPETLLVAMKEQVERAKMMAAARNAHFESTVQMKAMYDHSYSSFQYVLEKIDEAEGDLAAFDPRFLESLEAAQVAFVAFQKTMAQVSLRQLSR